MIQLGISGIPTGSRPWHHSYNFPETGITLLYSNLGYPRVLGHALGLMPHINFTLHQAGGFSLQLRYSAGLALITNPYREPDNIENQAIGSMLNINMSTSLQISVPVSSSLDVRAGIGMTHFSNGKMAVPNKGLNIPSARLELVHHFNRKPVICGQDYQPESYDQYSVAVYVAGGYTTLYPPVDDTFAEFTITSTISRRLSQKSAAGAGADIFFGYSDRALLHQQGTTPHHLTGLVKPGLHISYEQIFSKTSFILQKGIYLYRDYQGNGPFYHRIGFRHRVSQRWVMNLTLKSHFFSADYLEWGAGYSFR